MVSEMTQTPDILSEALDKSDMAEAVKPVKECIHNVHVIRKFDTGRFRLLKSKFRQFMKEGRQEFGTQLAKWQDLFLEAHEDIDDLAENHRIFQDRVD